MAEVPRLAITFFIVINFFIYLDRGIVPGAFKQFDALINEEIGSEHTETLFGALISVFIAGYAAASFVVGQLVHLYPPFRIVGTGLLLWTGSIVLAAVAPSYWVLLVARGLSGIGEASFQCIIAPFIDDYAPPEYRALVLGAFYAAIPMGTALGYIYGAELASASETLSWRLPFIVEAPLLLIMSLAVFQINVPKPKGMYGDEATVVRDSSEDAEEGGRGALVELADEESGAEEAKGGRGDGKGDAESDDVSVTLSAGLGRILTNWRFLTISFGFAAYNFTVAGFGAFAPSFLVNLRLFHAESAASTSVGAVVAGAGMIGTVVGGLLTDKAVAWLGVGTKSRVEDERLLGDGGEEDGVAEGGGGGEKDRAKGDRDRELVGVVLVGLVSVSVGAALAMSLPWMVGSAALFLAVTAFACIGLFVANGTGPLAMLASVAAEDRALAMGVGQIIQHAFGDVPSPTIIGAMTDLVAPQTPHGRSQEGLRLTLFAVMAWLLWVVLMWAISMGLAMRKASMSPCPTQA